MLSLKALHVITACDLTLTYSRKYLICDFYDLGKIAKFNTHEI